jgi:hypothetical protein
MPNNADFSSALLRLLPDISRARDFRLYTASGRRLVDLWQLNGQAILGHTPPSVLRELKNTASRGLFAPFPSHLEGRLVKALSRLFPGRAVRLFAGDASLHQALETAGYAAGPFPDPAFPALRSLPPRPEKPSPVLWRPFLEDPPAAAAAHPATPPTEVPAQQEAAGELLIPVLPLPWAGAPLALILSKEAEARFPVSLPELLSPVILAAAARSVWDLISVLPGAVAKPVSGAQPSRETCPFPRIRKALAQSPWQRRGVYLTMRAPPSEEAYAALFRRFLDQGFLLPPGPGQPLILPGVLSSGEEAALAALLESS